MCEITTGYTPGCDKAGGVATVFGFDLNAIDTLTVVAGEVTALTLKTGKYAYAFNVEMETANFKDQALGERANKAYAREHTGTIILHDNTKQDIVNIESLCKGRSVWAAELNDGTYELFFRKNGAKASDLRDTGTSFEDLNGNTITLAGREPNKAPKIAASLIAALLEPES